ncbi:MAG TPA: DMT family transporter [Candidatus Saccharimonadales bacterium]|nr:DMT family transporter [Candidatus Saccharimonadales bacterium]
MLWLFLLFIHVLGLTGFNLVLRRSLLEKVDRFTLATIMQTGIAVPAILLMIAMPPRFSAYEPKYYVGFIVEVVLGIALQVTNTKALQYLEASVYPVIYNLRILITTLLGILFLNEDVVWSRIFGGVLIFLAIIIVRQRSSRTVRLKGVEWGLSAALIISFLNLNEKLMINGVGLLNYWPPASVIAALLMWAYLLTRKQRFNKSLLIDPRMIKLMSLRALSGYTFPLALASGALLSVASYISAMSVILMVVSGVILLGERNYLWRKIAATAVAVTGMTIVLLSHLL